MEVTEVTIDDDTTDGDIEGFPIISFPFEALPERFRASAMRIASAFNIEPETVVCFQLPILAAALGNAVRISPKANWEEPPFLWQMVIAPTGYGKSPILSLLVKPVEHMESKAAVIDATTLKSCLSRSYMVSDTTVEALADVFKDSPRGVLIKTDELATLLLSLNQYKQRGNDKQHYLELFNCGSWKINRREKSILIRNTGASIVGGIQPSEMINVFGDGSVENGLLPRFLTLSVDMKPRMFSRETVLEEDLLYWQQTIESMYRIPVEYGEGGFVRSKLLKFSSAALDSYEVFHNRYENLMARVSDQQAAFVPKLRTYCVRLAGVLHAIECHEQQIDLTEEISSETTEKAARLIDFFAGQVTKALKIRGKKKDLSQQDLILVKILKDLENTVKQAQLPLMVIVGEYNAGMPNNAKLPPKRIAHMLRDLGFAIDKGTGNASFLTWDHKLAHSLFEKTGTR